MLTDIDTKRHVYSLREGQVIVELPAKIDVDELDDVISFFNLVVGQVQRMDPRSSADVDAREATFSNEVAERDSILFTSSLKGHVQS